jgi:hypothetical protein
MTRSKSSKFGKSGVRVKYEFLEGHKQRMIIGPLVLLTCPYYPVLSPSSVRINPNPTIVEHRQQ